MCNDHEDFGDSPSVEERYVTEEYAEFDAFLNDVEARNAWLDRQEALRYEELEEQAFEEGQRAWEEEFNQRF